MTAMNFDFIHDFKVLYQLQQKRHLKLNRYETLIYFHPSSVYRSYEIMFYALFVRGHHFYNAGLS